MYDLPLFGLFLGCIAMTSSQCRDFQHFTSRDECPQIGQFHWEVLGVQGRSADEQRRVLVEVVLQGFDCDRRIKNIRCPGVSYTCQQIQNDILSRNSTVCPDPDLMKRLVVFSLQIETIPCFHLPPQPGPPHDCELPMPYLMYKVASLWRPELIRHRIWNGCPANVAFSMRRKCTQFASPSNQWESMDMCPCYRNIITHLIQGHRILTDPRQRCDIQYTEDIFRVFGDSSAQQSYSWHMGKDGLNSVLQNLSNPYPPLTHSTAPHHTQKFHPHHAAVLDTRTFGHSDPSLMYPVPCSLVDPGRPHRPVQEPPRRTPLQHDLEQVGGTPPPYGPGQEPPRGTELQHDLEQVRGTPPPHGPGQEPPRGTELQHDLEQVRGTPPPRGPGQEPPRRTELQHDLEQVRGTPPPYGPGQEPPRGTELQHDLEQVRGTPPPHGPGQEPPRGTELQHDLEQVRGTPPPRGPGQEPPRGTELQHDLEQVRGTPPPRGPGQEPPRGTELQHDLERVRGTPPPHGLGQEPPWGPSLAEPGFVDSGGSHHRPEGHGPGENGNALNPYGSSGHSPNGMIPKHNTQPLTQWEHRHRERTSPATAGGGRTATKKNSGSGYSLFTQHTASATRRPGRVGSQGHLHGMSSTHPMQGFTSPVAETSTIRISTLRSGTKTIMRNAHVSGGTTNTLRPGKDKYKNKPRSKRFYMPPDSHHYLPFSHNYHSPKYVWNATNLLHMMLGTANNSLTIPDFYEMCPLLIHFLLFTFNLPGTTTTMPTTISNTPNTTSNTQNLPTTAQVYGYSSLAVFIISLCSLVGVLFVKVSKGKTGNYVMASMLALAVGNLCGDAVLHLVPEVIGEEGTDNDGDGHFTNEIMLLGNSDISMNSVKMMLMLAAIYLFFLLEMVMSVYHKHDHVTENTITIPESQIPKKKTLTRVVTGSTAHLTSSNSTLSSMELALPSSIDSLPSVPEENEDPEEEVQITIQKQDNIIAPMTLAWMVIVGDSIHNFADGLEIGATFSDGLASGLSTSLAVFCHELPHELGDFAVLISTGMSVKRALILNFVSGLTAFIGLYIGIVSGQHNSVRQLIFSIGAGMFIYVALANLVPELMKYFERNRNWRMFLCQHVGVLSGYTVMVLIAIYEDEISL
ncbi:zinc transporter ZIP6-like [Haliotis rufescens]|uniref:zinc transporter ZIP6-like n=1 Tax=Haliotis rufescens TaxID=6454 RepID=UPI00201E78A2|nr:zinc transporter ZIP6-like [Haliotis rufescens]